MEFLFIDNNTATDRRSQRLIRSHGMKGKNAGKVISARGHRWRRFGDEKTKPTRPDSVARGRPLLPKNPLPLADGDRVRAMQAMQAVSPADPFCGFEFSYFTTPVPITASSRQLFHDLHNAVSQELYPRAFCRQSNEIGTRWFETLMTNPCVYHCGLAIMGIHRFQLLGRRDEPIDATRHLLQAMRLLRHDLDAVPNKTYETSAIAVIISLAIRANLAGAVAESRTHLHALQRIVELRPGGLAALCAAVPELGNKIRRTDAELALCAGMPTVFGSRHLPLPAPLFSSVSLLDDGWRRSAALPCPLQDVCTELQPAIRDIFVMCSYAGRSQLGTVQFQDLVISIIQRLVDYAPLDGARPPRPLDDICQLSFLSFMTTVLHREPRKRSSYARLLSGLFRARLESFCLGTTFSNSVSSHAELALWLNFTYAMSAACGSEPCWRVNVDLPTAGRICALSEVLAVSTWEDAVAHLRVFPWVEAFHGDTGGSIWAQATCRLQS
ncbi:hypothetical protein SCUCBS95973_002240 [Sporothrix curviconia]|uniref:Uncharacterized protein n=1 Tax=Sporothrix curviconia TaxID=1260050 RepID=A0ABP0B5B7_9PEZI